MATYAIGDIQGCYQTFKALLKKINFNPNNDCLWLAGDMINRGSGSLDVLSFIYDHQDSIRCVLGNHDLHFLAVECGAQTSKRKDTLDEILNSPLRQTLTDYLLKQPLFYYDASLNIAMAHAGIPPCWHLEQTTIYAQEVSDCLQSDQRQSFFANMYGNEPTQWHDNLSGFSRLRYITNALTRMRYCQADGALELTSKMPPSENAHQLIPWYQLSQHVIDCELIFGHWASLQGHCPVSHFYALDTGCVWDGYLTALRLEDKAFFQCSSVEDS